jgi:hypothetical protein
MNCAVVIPIYKSTPSDTERKSFDQVLKILGTHPIVLLTYKELILDYYFQIGKINHVDLKIEYFEKSFFEDLKGYNSLCLDVTLYKRFMKYDYILIYQLDAYVFSNKLDYWCNKGYDYIGAPWFDDNLSHEEGANLWAIGNGGFSLRKISAFRNLFVMRKNIFGLKQLYKKKKLTGKGFLWLFKAWIFGHENNFKFLLSEWTDAEDLFYCLRLSDTKLKLKVPALKDAIDFAFEQSPRYLFELNNNTLPFGCHAWNRYETNSFWRKYIPLIKDEK